MVPLAPTMQRCVRGCGRSVGPSWVAAAGLGLTLGCGASGASVLKSPVQDECESAGLTGCPQIADGVVLYADGKQAEGQDKLKSGAAANTPDDVRQFAKALAAVTSLPIPGIGQYVGPINQIAELLATEADASAMLAAKSAPPPKSGKAKATVAPSGEPGGREREREAPQGPSVVANDGPAISQTVSESTQAWSGRSQCHLFGRNVSCAPVQQGPFIVTDIVALPGCKDVMYVGSNARDNPYQEAVTYVFKWAVEAEQPGVHGAHLAVHPGESLLVAVEPKDGAVVEDPKCIVSWSGYHPRRQGQ